MGWYHVKRYSSYSQKIESTDKGTVLSGLPYLDMLYTGKEVWHTVKQNEQYRLDLIAYKYLRDPSLWYVIAQYNGIQDPIAEVITGRDIAIPVTPLKAIGAMRPFTYRGTE